MRKFEISLSTRAKLNLNSLLVYLEGKWSKKVQENFILKLDEAINQVSIYPYSSKESEELKGVYKKVITKQTSFYYRISGNEIEIITIRDNRKNPMTIKL